MAGNTVRLSRKSKKRQSGVLDDRKKHKLDPNAPKVDPEEYKAYDASHDTLRDRAFPYIEENAEGFVSKALKKGPPRNSGISDLEWRRFRSTMQERDVIRAILRGWTTKRIADYMGWSEAHTKVVWQRGVNRVQVDNADDMRRHELARLNTWLEVLEDRIEQGDLSAMDRALKIQERKAKLFGLDIDRKLLEGEIHHTGGVVVVAGNTQDDYVGRIMAALPPGDRDEVIAELAGQPRILSEAMRQDILDKYRPPDMDEAIVDAEWSEEDA